jgi:peptidoglycan hydrolase-like protein with peptidoglycan-binding domain
MTTEALGVEHRATFLKDAILKRGDSGPAVTDLQKHLMNAGYNIGTPDGDFGQKTYDAVIAFQKASGLVIDGKVGPKTMGLLCDAEKSHKYLCQDDIVAAAKSLGVPTAALMAVNEVESKGTGFLANGRIAILYERHIMYRELKDYGVDPDRAMRENPGLVNKARGGYLGGEKEWVRLENAMTINKDAALESASWGAYQIMGFHWQLLGFNSVQDYVKFTSISEANQLECFVRFVKSQKGMWNALKALNWAEFARLYNGAAYKENQYDTKLSTAFKLYSSYV